MIKLKRVYDSVAPNDGQRFLLERLWPRGIKKTDLHVSAWLKDVVPKLHGIPATIYVVRQRLTSDSSQLPFDPQRY